MTCMRGILIALVVSGMVAGAPAMSQAQAASGNPPTFNEDVAPILFDQCASCHRPGEIAPMPLLSYGDARPWARAIRSKVVAREMPPWGADPHYGEFSNERRLTQKQIDTIAAWADAGAPEGAGTPPELPVFSDATSGFMEREPDLVIEMPVEIEIPAEGEIPMFLLWHKAPFGADKFFEAVEMRPSNRAVTHHSSVRAGPVPDNWRIGTGPAWPGGPVVEDAVLLPLEEGLEATSDSSRRNFYFCCYVPGGGSQRYAPGTAKRLRPTDHINWRMHYTVNGKPEKDRHTLGLWYASEPVTHEVITLSGGGGSVVIADEDELLDREKRPNIPAFADNWRIDGISAFPNAVTLLGLWPHMHVRGKDMKYVVTYPDGREETLLDVPNYEFEWQFYYELAEPLRLPAGSVMRVTAHYDNSRGNRGNPTPEKEVIWGDQSWQEMFTPFVDLTIEDEVVSQTSQTDQ